MPILRRVNTSCWRQRWLKWTESKSTVVQIASRGQLNSRRYLTMTYIPVKPPRRKECLTCVFEPRQPVHTSERVGVIGLASLWWPQIAFGAAEKPSYHISELQRMNSLKTPKTTRFFPLNYCPGKRHRKAIGSQRAIVTGEVQNGRRQQGLF